MSDAVYRSIVEGDDDAYHAVVISQAQKLAASGRMRHPDGRSWVPDDVFELASGLLAVSCLCSGSYQRDGR